MKVHEGLILVAIFFSLAYVQLVKGQPRKDCQTRCGDVAVEYPFGISSGCYYAEDPSFKLTCSNETEGLLFGNIPVINISHNSELRVWVHRSYDCYNSLGNSTDWLYFTYTLGNLTLSDKNRFTAVGCDTYAYLRVGDYSSGCMSICNSIPKRNGECSGEGCCQTSIPKGNMQFRVRANSFDNHSFVYNYNPCSYAFLVENGSFHFNVLEDLKNLSDGCQDINECTTNNTFHKHNCSDPNTCRNKDGGFYCKCQSGYRLDTTTMSCKRKTFGWAMILLGTTIGFLVILLAISCIKQKMKQRKYIALRQKFFEKNGGGMLIQRVSGAGPSNVDVKIFTEEGMKEATNGYDESRILGQGGQGTVYKGILPDNSIVAIKKARLGDNSQVEQFINEVLVLSQINHRNVVKLLGCCLETEVPLLVYEFITNGTLFDHLHGSMCDSSLTWEQRLTIAIEVAGTLAYLHSSASIPIIHRDIKTANILLDENLTAKVADFGASRLIPMDKDELTTMVQGTRGYLDPEYYNTGLLNEKSDVYSFGVVLMELLSGQKAFFFEQPQQSKHVVGYFASATKENRLHEIIDGQVMNEYNQREIQEAARIALECTRIMGEERP